MVKIYYNKLTGRVFGTEESDDPSVQTDCVDDISNFVEHLPDGTMRLKDHLYFIKGKLKIAKDAEPDYFDIRRQLCIRISEARQAMDKENDASLTERLLSGVSLDDAIKEIQETRNLLDHLQAELDELDTKYQNELKVYNEKLDARMLCELNPASYSAVCLLIRDENEYLREWIEHYIAIGVDCICIYDNGVNEAVTDIVSMLPGDMREKIEILPYHRKTDTLQQDAYNDFLKRYSKKARWAALVDSDEFIDLEDGTSINSFLKDYEEYGAVHMNWVMYNANGQESKQDGNVRQRFTSEVPEPNNHIYRFQGKEFVQLYKVERFARYHPVFVKEEETYRNNELNLDRIKLSHYYTKSLEEWKNKISRGSCDPIYLKSFQEFFKLNPDMKHLNTGENYKQEYCPRL